VLYFSRAYAPEQIITEYQFRVYSSDIFDEQCTSMLICFNKDVPEAYRRKRQFRATLERLCNWLWISEWRILARYGMHYSRKYMFMYNRLSLQCFTNAIRPVFPFRSEIHIRLNRNISLKSKLLRGYYKTKRRRQSIHSITQMDNKYSEVN